jgi:uncharacterized protein YgbK (DUF1537 family)
MVTADDRTGALEVAAQIAGSVGPVDATVGRAPDGAGVVDLQTRSLSDDAAALLAGDAPVAGWNAHKIDSTLRGNWAAETRARSVSTGLRVVLVPAWPAMGRTCVGGVVHVLGAPVAAVRSSLEEVDQLTGPAQLASWLRGSAKFAAVDVEEDVQLLEVADVLVDHDVLLVGPAGPIGAAFAARFGVTAPTTAPLLALPALVVCGSASDVSHEQLRRLKSARPDIEVLVAPPSTGPLVPGVAASLAADARVRAGGMATVVVVGGDTAAAFLGDSPRRVHGTVLPGLPWSLDQHDGGHVVVTKAGGFGVPDTLVRVFGDRYGA